MPNTGDRIRFIRQLDCPPTEDHPGFLYARAGELGRITKVGDCVEGYWVKADSWPHAFGASADEFEVIHA